ncbi:MAG: DUF4920 domain-containing protein [Aureispira sp.]
MLRLLYILAVVYAITACGDSANHDHDHAGHDHDHAGHNHDHDHDHAGHEHAAAEGSKLGDAVNPLGAMSADQVVAKVESDEGTVEYDLGEGVKVQAIPAKIEGTVAEVCQAAGCWLTVQTSDGTELFVDTKHKFLFPKDIVGKTIVIEGNAYKSVETVEELRHNAKEAGESEENIAAITAPKSNYTLVANGAVLK